MKKTPAYVCPPGMLILEEMEARGWNVYDLKASLHIDTYFQTVNLLEGKTEINHDMAVSLSKLFGTSVELWENLEKSYRESLKGVA